MSLIHITRHSLRISRIKPNAKALVLLIKLIKLKTKLYIKCRKVSKLLYKNWTNPISFIRQKWCMNWYFVNKGEKNGYFSVSTAKQIRLNICVNQHNISEIHPQQNLGNFVQILVKIFHSGQVLLHYMLTVLSSSTLNFEPKYCKNTGWLPIRTFWKTAIVESV